MSYIRAWHDTVISGFRWIKPIHLRVHTWSKEGVSMYSLDQTGILIKAHHRAPCTCIIHLIGPCLFRKGACIHALPALSKYPPLWWVLPLCQIAKTSLYTSTMRMCVCMCEGTGGQVVKAFDCGSESPRFKSHLLLHKVKSFSLPLLPLDNN